MKDDIKVEDLNQVEEQPEVTESPDNNKRSKKKKNKKKKKGKKVLVALITLFILASLYCIAVFSSIPFIAKWRTLYIETAMTTNSHQWLATYFIPPWVIDDVMKDYYAEREAQKALESKWESEPETETETETEVEVDEEAEFYEKYWELNTYAFHDFLDARPTMTQYGYDKILIEDLDNELGLTTIKGDPLLVLDTENNLMIIGVSSDAYQGKMAIVKNPEQIDLVKAESLGRFGELVDAYGERYDAALAINASGFADVGGHGTGAQVKGSLIIDRMEYGSPHGGFWKFYGMKYDNRLYVTNYSSDITSEYRWALEFYPALIVDGECVVDGTYGMGIQPRTTIGQAENGDFMLLIVDGRQVGYSLGCTVQECSDIMMEYGAIQGANLDGGSSSVMWYKGQQITRSSSAAGNGRYMPDALIVQKTSNMNKAYNPYGTTNSNDWGN